MIDEPQEIVTDPVERERFWNEWLADRPKIIQEMGEKLKPWHLYRLTTTDQKVTLYSFSEDGTVTVDVVEGRNADHRVFGIRPDDLEVIE